MSYLSRLSDALDSGGLREPGVLVVEDDRELARVYSIWLDEAGFDVDVAHDGEEALNKVDEDLDVILLDRRMPAFSGGEVAEVLRSDDIQDITARRFRDGAPYADVSEESWNMDFSLDVARALEPDVVRNLQREDIDLQICMLTAVKPSLDVLDLEFDHYVVKDVERGELVETVSALARLSKVDEIQRRYQRLRLKQKVLEEQFREKQLVHDERYKQLLEIMDEIEMRAGGRVADVKQVPFP